MLDLVSKCYIQTSLATSWIWYIKVLKHFCNQSWFPFQHLSLLIIYKQTLPLTSSLVSLIACMIKNRYMVSGVKVSFDGMARRLANAVFPHMQGLNEHLLWCWHPTKLRHSGTSLWQKGRNSKATSILMNSDSNASKQSGGQHPFWLLIQNMVMSHNSGTSLKWTNISQ